MERCCTIHTANATGRRPQNRRSRLGVTSCRVYPLYVLLLYRKRVESTGRATRREVDIVWLRRFGTIDRSNQRGRRSERKLLPEQLVVGRIPTRSKIPIRYFNKGVPIRCDNGRTTSRRMLRYGRYDWIVFALSHHLGKNGSILLGPYQSTG